MEIHDEVYVPEYSIQGEDIPLSITWDKSKKITISVSLPENVEINEIYNTSDLEFEKSKNILNVNKFEVNGYLGMVMQTKSQRRSMIDDEIVVKIKYNDEEKIIIKKIRLFRPDIKLIYLPNVINIIKNDDKLDIQNKIIITNCGKGTGLIKIKENESSELKLVDLGGIEEFTKKVIDEFVERIKILKEKYPQYFELIDNFIKTREVDVQFDTIGNIKNSVSDLTKAFEANREFMDEFISILYISYMSNLSIIVPLESFIQYLKSINIGRIIMSNPISVLKVTPSYKTFNAELTLADLAYNPYEPIKLNNIRINSNIECDVPIYALFDFVSDLED